MAANAPVVLTDGTTPTPVNRTFTATSVEKDVAVYSNRAEPYILGRDLLTLRRKATPRVRTTTATITVPRVITEVLNGVNVKKVESFSQLEVKVIVPVSWEKTLISVQLPMLADLINEAAFKAIVEDDEFVW
ncbi:MAG: coat protein [Leviviridae sp.]|nr:MAG: coat protein [Leviviridae sp.]